MNYYNLNNKIYDNSTLQIVKLNIPVIINSLSSLTFGILIVNIPTKIINTYVQSVNFDKTNQIDVAFLESSIFFGALVGMILFPNQLYKRNLDFGLLIILVMLILSLALQAIQIHWVYLLIIRLVQGFLITHTNQITSIQIMQIKETKKQTNFISSFGVLIGCTIHIGISFNYVFWQLSLAAPFIIVCIGLIFEIIKVKCNNNLMKEQNIEIFEMKSPQENLLDIDNIHPLQESPTFMEEQNEEAKLKVISLKSKDSTLDFTLNPQKLTKKQFQFHVLLSISLSIQHSIICIIVIVQYASTLFYQVFDSNQSGYIISSIFCIIDLAFQLLFIKIELKLQTSVQIVSSIISVISLLSLSAIFKLKFNISIIVALCVILIIINCILRIFTQQINKDMNKKYIVRLLKIEYLTSFSSFFAITFAFAFFIYKNQYIIFGILSIIDLIAGCLGIVALVFLNRQEREQIPINEEICEIQIKQSDTVEFKRKQRTTQLARTYSRLSLAETDSQKGDE